MATKATPEPAPNRSFRDLMAEAQPAERTVDICLRGDLVAALEVLEREFEAARKRGGASSKEDIDPAAGILAQIEAAQAEMQASTSTFRMRKVPPIAYRELRAQHPPREKGGEYDQGDLNLGFNRITMFPVLIPMCTFEPDLSADEWHALLGDSETDGLINYGQLLELSQAAYDVNESSISIPFSLAALRAKLATAGE